MEGRRLGVHQPIKWTRSRMLDEAQEPIGGQEGGSPLSDVEAFEIVRGRDIDTQGFIAINDDHILAGFQGTESLPDWLTNLQTVKDPGPWRRTEVHEGFQDARSSQRP